MTTALWEGTEVAPFLAEQWRDAHSRRMFFLGQISVKVAAMFAGESSPEAQKAAALWLIGLESADATVYAECDAKASQVHAEWSARRTLQ